MEKLKQAFKRAVNRWAEKTRTEKETEGHRTTTLTTDIFNTTGHEACTPPSDSETPTPSLPHLPARHQQMTGQMHASANRYILLPKSNTTKT